MHSPADPQFANARPERDGRRLSVASVTVTYNGASTLRRHLESLKKQTRALEEMVVVDNASTDATRSLLETEFPEITLLPLSENIGIAGGLAEGLTYAALKKKYDWIWIFDQDSVPSPDALEHLLRVLPDLGDAEEQTGILAPICAHPETQMSYPALRWQNSRFAPIPLSPNQRVTFADMVISSGTLIRREAIEQAGLPRSDFFMDFVDYEHCLRLRRHNFRIAVVRDSTLDHAIGSPRTFSILGRQKSWANHAPWRAYYMTRNEVFTIWRYYPRLATKVFVLRRVLQHALGVLLFGRQKLECLRMICLGFLDGLAGRLGKRFVPDDSKSSGPTASVALPRSSTGRLPKLPRMEGSS